MRRRTSEAGPPARPQGVVGETVRGRAGQLRSSLHPLGACAKPRETAFCRTLANPLAAHIPGTGSCGKMPSRCATPSHPPSGRIRRAGGRRAWFSANGQTGFPRKLSAIGFGGPGSFRNVKGKERNALFAVLGPEHGKPLCFRGFQGWWWGKDSNLRRQSRQIYSLMRLATSLPHQGGTGSGNGWSRRDSNPRPLRCERNALPTELLPRQPEMAGKVPSSRKIATQNASSRGMPRRTPFLRPAWMPCRRDSVPPPQAR